MTLMSEDLLPSAVYSASRDFGMHAAPHRRRVYPPHPSLRFAEHREKKEAKSAFFKGNVYRAGAKPLEKQMSAASFIFLESMQPSD